MSAQALAILERQKRIAEEEARIKALREAEEKRIREEEEVLQCLDFKRRIDMLSTNLDRV
jgi:hypothetical protein